MNVQQCMSGLLAIGMLLGGQAQADSRERGQRDGQYDHQQRLQHGDDRRDGWHNEKRHDRGHGHRVDRGHVHRSDGRYDSRHGGRYEGRGAGPEYRYYRGQYLPPQYRGGYYVVEDWRGHRLYAPPRGYHWVQMGSDYLLVAMATGLILQLMLSN